MTSTSNDTSGGAGAADQQEADELAGQIVPAPIGVTGFVGHSQLGPVGQAVVCDNESTFNRHFGDWEEAPQLAPSVHGFFQNGGPRCVVVNLGATERGISRRDLEPLDDHAELELVCAPGKTSPSDHDALLTHAANVGTRLALLDGPSDLETSIARLRPPTGAHGAMYVPWLLVHDPVRRELVRVPPSGFMAGLMARVAAERGIHKAPANEAIHGIAGLSHRITQAEQDILHPRAINAIRKLSHIEGIRPWAAKTLAPRQPLVTISAFRVLAHVIRSIEQSTTWLVGSASEPSTWERLEEAGLAFLSELREQGSLQGDSAEAAYRFECNATTNPPEQRMLGIVVMSIGLALLSPERFYTFQMGLDLSPE